MVRYMYVDRDACMRVRNVFVVTALKSTLWPLTLRKHSFSIYAAAAYVRVVAAFNAILSWPAIRLMWLDLHLLPSIRTYVLCLLPLTVFLHIPPPSYQILLLDYLAPIESASSGKESDG